MADTSVPSIDARAGLSRAAQIIKRWDHLKSRRAVWEGSWQSIRELVRPDSADFGIMHGNRGQLKTEKIFDSTAPWALNQLASSLHSQLTSPFDRWFNITVDGGNDGLRPEALSWLEDVSDIMYRAFSDPGSHFVTALHEGYMDVASYGTEIIYQDWDMKRQNLIFRAFPLADCYIDLDDNDNVDTLFREVKLSVRQIKQMFNRRGDFIPDRIANSEMHREFTVVHAVFPRTDRDASKLNGSNRPFASMWVSIETKDILRNHGFTMFPYLTARWTKIAGEIYGRGPGMTALPDIRMLNAMSKTVIKAAQKIVDPPLMVPNEGYMLPIRTAPGSLMVYEPGTDTVIPLETKGRINIGIELMNQRRDQIAKSFFVDWLLQQKNDVEMTATEVIDRRNEKLELLSPVIGRLQAELLGPVIRNSYHLLLRHGRIPATPPSLQGTKLDIEYVSPAARAQFGSKAANIQRFIADLAPISERAPEIFDVINTTELARQVALMRDVSRKVLNDQETVDEIRRLRAEEKDLQNNVAVGREAAAALKDVAKAGELGGIPTP